MKHYILYILVFSLLSSCSSKYSQLLDNATILMQDKPDSALAILSAIKKDEVSSHRIKAKYALLYSQALDKNWIDVDNDSLISYAVDYYKNHGNDIDKAKAYYYYGIVHNNAADIGGAMESFVKARIYAEKTSNIYLNGLIYNVIGNLYYDQCSFEEAVKMYSDAVSAFSNIGNKRNQLYAINSKGLAQFYLNQPNEAIKSLTVGLHLADELGDTSTLMDIISALGGIHATIHDADSMSLGPSKDYLIQTYMRYTDGKIPIDHYPIMGNIYYEEKQIDSARFYFTEYLKLKPEITETNFGIFAVLSSIEKKMGDYKKAHEYERLFSFYTDSINNAHKIILIQNLEKKYKAEYFQKLYASLRAKYRYEITILILLISIVILLVGFLTLSYKRAIRERNQQKAEFERYVSEVQIHYSELMDKYKSISKDVRTEKTQALFNILENRIHSLQSLLELASKYENNTDAFYKNFKEHIKVVSGNNKELADDVIAIANLSCYGIIKYLEQLYPSLSKRELCYCSFICLGFSPESIRILYNHTNVYSIYTIRSKIRSKLGVINNAINLETHILNMMEKLKTEAME